MTLIVRRRELLTAGALATTAAVLPSPLHSYGNYGTARLMRAPSLEEGESVWQWLVLLVDASSSMRQLFEQMTFIINAVVMKGYDGTVEEMYQYYLDNVITSDGIIFKVENEKKALEALATANASKFCAEISLVPDHHWNPA